MAEITVLGGAGQIGGNKILLRDSNIDLMFDFGMNFEQTGKYFAEFLKPRDSNSGTYDFLMTGLLPPVGGVYRDDASVSHLEPVGWQEAQSRKGLFEARPAALLLSHAHVDHSGYIGFLKPDIKIVSSSMTAVIAKAIQDTGQVTLEGEVTYYVERHEDESPAKRLRDTGLRLPRLERPVRKAEKGNNLRSWLATDYKSWGEDAAAFWATSPNPEVSMNGPPVDRFDGVVGGLCVRTFPVDHSIMGAEAFAVETAAGWVVYTGDVRLHGKNGHLTRRFAEAVAALRPAALLCEGTRVSPEPSVPSTEEIVHEKSRRVVAESRGLVVADFGPRNVERLTSFREIAREADRQLVVLARDAYLLEAMANIDPDVPVPGDDADLLVYTDRTGDMAVWQQLLLARRGNALVRWEEVSAHPDQYVVCFSLYDMPRLLDINPSEGTYIFSTTEPFNVETELDMVRLRNWIARFNLRLVGDPELKGDPEHEGLHAGGHAPKEDIHRLIDIIRPRLLIPIHTNHPELMAQYGAELGIEVAIPRMDRPETISI